MPLRRGVLLRKASSPGPAPERLRGLPPRRDFPELPFEIDAIPGLSPATHALHYNRHYCEYARRWEETERDVLTRATAIGLGRDRGRIPQIRGRLEFARQSAALVLLHDHYWEVLSRGEGASEIALNHAFHHIERACHSMEWMWLVVENGRARFLPDMDTAFLLGGRIEAAIDLADHAWLVDHDDMDDYLSGTILPCAGPWEEALATGIENLLEHGPSRVGDIQMENQAFIHAMEPLEEGEAHDRVGRILSDCTLEDLDPDATLKGLRHLAGESGSVLFGKAGGYTNPDILLLTDQQQGGLPFWELEGWVQGLA